MLHGVHTSAMSPAEAAMLPVQSETPSADVPAHTLPPLARALLYAPGIVLPGRGFVRPGKRNGGRKQAKRM